MAHVKRDWLEDVVGKSRDLPRGYRVLGRNNVAAIEKEGAKFVSRSAYVFWAEGPGVDEEDDSVGVDLADTFDGIPGIKIDDPDDNNNR